MCARCSVVCGFWRRRENTASCVCVWLTRSVVVYPVNWSFYWGHLLGTLFLSTWDQSLIAADCTRFNFLPSHTKKIKIKKGQFFLKTAAEPFVAETTPIDAFSSCQWQLALLQRQADLPYLHCSDFVSLAIFQIPFPSSLPLPLVLRALRCVAAETRCVARGRLCYLAGTVCALLVSRRATARWGAAVVLFSYCVAPRDRKAVASLRCWSLSSRLEGLLLGNLL